MATRLHIYLPSTEGARAAFIAETKVLSWLLPPVIVAFSSRQMESVDALNEHISRRDFLLFVSM
jgi:hypothetical protein